MRRLWILYAVVMLICLIYSIQHKKRRCVQIVTLAMVFFSGLRSWWYGDLIKYYTRFLTDSGLSLIEIFTKSGWRNLGLSLLNKSAYAIFGIYGYDVVIFLIALFSAVTLGKLILYFSPSAYWSYLMYFSVGFFTFTLSGLKQTIAMGFCCLAMIALLEDKLKQFLIFVGLGALFHAPALLFVIAYPFSKKKIGKTYFLYVAAFFAFMIIFRNNLAYLLEDTYYSESAAEVVLMENETGVGGRFIGMVLIMVFAAVMRRPGRKYADYSKVLNIMVLAAAIQTMSVFDNTYTRLADYFYQFVVLFVPMFMVPARTREELAIGNDRLLARTPMTYVYLSLGVTVFSIWFYSAQIQNIEMYGKILFFWECNGHLLYGS